MKPPSQPRIDRSNDKMWFISWNQDIPYQLWDKYGVKRKRIKIYDNINRYKGQEREEYADRLVKLWSYRLFTEKYSHYEAELAEFKGITREISEAKQEIKELELEILDTEKGNTNIVIALEAYLNAKIESTTNTNSHSTHRGLIKWFKHFLTENNLLGISVNRVTRQHIADSLLFTRKDRQWNPTTYNSNVEMLMTVFNWFEMEEYISKNPARGKIQKQKATVGRHAWYRKEVADKIKSLMKTSEQTLVYNACAFTYHLCVRSQQELLKLKVSDIDFRLKQIRFRKEVSKNGIEAYRDFSPEFEDIARGMKLDKKPGHFYIFGSGGEPSTKMAGKNSLAMPYKKVKDKLKMDDNFTIYGWKHTRVIHEMMKGTDIYAIQHLCRHQSSEETQKYMRGFDISLRKVYEPEDLTF